MNDLPHRARMLICSCAGLLLAVSSQAEEPPVFLWQDVTHNLPETEVMSIAVDPSDPQGVFVGTRHAVYRTTTAGRRWDLVQSWRGSDAAVRALLVVPQEPQHVLVATDQGLWLSRDAGRRWQRMLRTAPCRQLIADASRATRLWLGTADGLWRSEDAGRTWRAITGVAERQAVMALAASPHDPAQLYLATERGLLRTTDAWQTWESSLLARATGSPPAEARDVVDVASDDMPATVMAIAVHPERSEELVLVSAHELLRSQDRGRSWAAVPSAGLGGVTFHAAVITAASAPRLYVATDRGVWMLDEPAGRWHELYRGLTAKRVNQVAVQTLDGSLWIATDRGVFHGAALPSEAPRSPVAVWSLWLHEPTVEQVQGRAIQYSETHPDKIARWRRAAATKALLPKVSFSVERNQALSDRYDEGTYPKFQLIPTRDLDRNWEVGVSWDLSELLWTNDQTAIDVRSKLTAELRDQIVGEATRLYFERRRLQMTQGLTPLPEPKAAVEQALRIQELTAQLDGLTGGWFSRALEGAEE